MQAERAVGSRGHDVYSRTTGYSQLDSFSGEKRKDKHVPERNFDLWRALDRFSDLDYATCSRCVIEKALKMKNEHGWEHLNQHLLARFI